MSKQKKDAMRSFNGGATRHSDEGKLDYEGFLSPIVLERYAQYLDKHRIQADGKVRASDNWTKGIPTDVYMKSLVRHLMEAWRMHRATIDSVSMKDGDNNAAHEDALCAVLFNTMGYLFELQRGK